MKYKNKTRLLSLGKGISLSTSIIGYSGGIINAASHVISNAIQNAKNEAYLLLNDAENRANNIIDNASNTTINVDLEETLEDIISEHVNINPQSSVQVYGSSSVNSFLDYVTNTWEAIPYDVKVPLIIAGISTVSYSLCKNELKRLYLERKFGLEIEKEINDSLK